MAKKEAIREVQKESGIYYLDDQYYSDEFGWSEEAVKGMKTLNA
jgi:CRISPR-associated endonuclease/helicase Cas3